MLKHTFLMSKARYSDHGISQELLLHKAVNLFVVMSRHAKILKDKNGQSNQSLLVSKGTSLDVESQSQNDDGDDNPYPKKFSLTKLATTNRT